MATKSRINHQEILVVVGNCLTAEEAIILKGKIASTFPKAFVKSEEFSMADLLN